jgi:hypothetical protein
MLWAIITYIAILLTFVCILTVCAITALEFKTVRRLYHNNLMSDTRLFAVWMTIATVVGVIATTILEFNR